MTRAIVRTARAGAWAFFGAVALAAAAAPAAPPAGEIQSVTLYRDQALVTRTVPADGPAGAAEAVVSDLPERIVPDSLFAEGDGAEIRAVRFRTRAVGEAPAAEVRKIEAEIEDVERAVEANQRMQALVSERLAYLGKLENFVAPTVSVEMAKGVLNADALKAVTLFNFEQRKAAAEESLVLAKEARALSKRQDLLQRRLQETSAGSSRQVREAVVFLDRKAAGKASFRLSYLVAGAGWTPAYNFRAEQGGQTFRAEYNAQIRQQSGEDWDGVGLTLSTASPSLVAEVPGLAPFRVALAAGGQAQSQDGRSYIMSSGGSGKSRSDNSIAFRQARTAEQRLGLNWAWNEAANKDQFQEFVNPKETVILIQKAVADAPSVEYRIAAPVSLASRPDQQTLRVSDMKLAGKFYRVASPVLASYVYREAELTNASEDALLGGPVNAYLDGRFVGRGEIPTVSRGETFVVGFGADGQVRAKRELVDRKESVQGGNREIAFKYRLVIESFRDEAVQVRLQDRIPVAQRDADVRVTLGEMSDKLSADLVYLRAERPKGILRWDVDVKAKASGDQAKFVTYDFRLEYDRNMALGLPGQIRPGAQQDGAPNPAAGQEEFLEMQQNRAKK